MPTYRLFITTNELGASTAFDILGRAFEDEGHAVATTEIDEDAGIWQASIYFEGDNPEASFGQIMANMPPDFAEFAKEVHGLDKSAPPPALPTLVFDSRG
mgnify:CR=1 FL=1